MDGGSIGRCCSQPYCAVHEGFLHARLARMNRFIRIVLLHLLALALPVQGWAAATQSICAPAMHQSSMQIAHDESIHVAVVDHAHDQHLMHAQHDQADQPSSQHDQSVKIDPVAKIGGHGSATCSVCAACYIGMALLPAMPDLLKPVYRSSAAVAVVPSFFLGHIPDGIKRPPRHLLV